MRAKRVSLTILLLLLALQVSALEFSKVVDLFKSYVEDYKRETPRSELVRSVKNELVNLAVYRFYKIQMVGSLEKRELSLTSSDFLTELYDRYQPSSLEEKIAFSAFLAYLVSDIRGKSLGESSVMKMPAFSKAFNLYRMDVRKALRDILANDILYLVGLAEKPVIASLSGRQVEHLKISGIPRLHVNPENLKKHEEILGKGLAEGLIQTARDFARRLETEGKSWKPIRVLAEARRAAFELITRETGEYQRSLASAIAAAAPKKMNVGWLRLVFYGIAMALVFFIKKARRFSRWVFFSIVVAEALYILFAYDPVGSIVDSFIYAVTVIPAFLFATLLFAVRAFKGGRFRIFDQVAIASSIVAVFLGLGVSAYRNVPELRMNAFPGFHDSVYYDLLKEDVYVSDISPLRRTVVDLKSLISKEVNQTQDTVRKLANFLNTLRKEEAVSDIKVTPFTVFTVFPKYSEFFEIENGPRYRKEFSNIASILNNFTVESGIRHRHIRDLVVKLEDELSRVLTYGDGIFREELMANLKTRLSGNRYSATFYNRVESAVSGVLSKKPISASVKVYQLRYGIIAVLVLALAVTMTVLKRGWIVVVMAVASGLVSVWMLVNWRNVQFFVQQGVPTLSVRASSGFLPWYFIFTLVVSILLIIINFRREA